MENSNSLVQDSTAAGAAGPFEIILPKGEKGIFMLRVFLRSRWALLILVLAVVVPAAFADYFTPGNPCHAERTTYYENGAVVGVDEYICYQGHNVWGKRTSFYTYEYFGKCCTRCTSQGVCGLEP